MSSNNTDSKTETDVDNNYPTKNLATLRSRILAMVYDGLIILFISFIVIIVIQLALIGDQTLPPDHILTRILKPMWFLLPCLLLAKNRPNTEYESMENQISKSTR